MRINYPAYFPRVPVAFVADDAEDSRGKAGGENVGCAVKREGGAEERGEGYTSGIIGV